MLVVDRIKRLVLRQDVLIAYAKSMIENAKSRMDLYQNQTSKKKYKRFVLAKIDYERYSTFLEEIIRQKELLLHNLEIIFDKHNKRYKKIFQMYYIDEKQPLEIASELGYSIDAVNKIIKEMNNDLVKAYRE